MRNRKGPDLLQSQDRIYFHQFYEEYKRFIYFIAGKFSTSPTDRDDLVQETIIRLMRNVETLKQLDDYKLAKYISVTVKAAYLDSCKYRKREHLIFLDDVELEKLLVEQLSYVSPEQRVFTNWAVDELRKSLAERDWLVLESKYFLELSQEEIGELIGISPDSVRMVLHRARKKARSILERNAVGGDGYE